MKCDNKSNYTYKTVPNEHDLDRTLINTSIDNLM